MEWRDSLRANLSLWPNLTVNLAALSSCSGKSWDESKFLDAIKKEADGVPNIVAESADEVISGHDDLSPEVTSEGKSATTSRTVRQTIEIMILSGLAYRDEEKIFYLTQLGATLLDFLRLRPNGASFANNSNSHLAGRLILPGLLAVPEYRSMLLLCTAVDGWITTEEMNRAIKIMSLWSHPEPYLIQSLANVVNKGRQSNDVKQIGPRWYRDEDYGTGKAGDQRKAVNPWLLLAGGGGLVLTSGDQNERRVHPLLIEEIVVNSKIHHSRLIIPSKNIVENSKIFAQSFSNICI